MKNIDKKMAEAAKSILGGRPMFEHQRLACAALLAGRNVLLVSPTGSGKSLCYQLPTLLSGKPTLVVSPLIALMDDQEEKTRSLGLSVGRLHSGVDLAKQWWTVGSWINGTLRILYTSPERLCDDRLRRSLGQRPPGLIVIDEAHCISTWGHRFRPAYRRLGETLNAFAKAPTLAMTASARPAVRQDILQTLKLDDPLSIIVPFSFPRLRLSTVETYRPEERLVFIAALASSPGRLPMVVFCLTKKQCQSTAYFLAQSGHSVTTYHAEMTVQDRADVATTFRGATRAVLVATSAYEMGIDKSDIRTVVHSGLPTSLESYTQGIGRAGRDGADAVAVLLYSERDLDILDAVAGHMPEVDGSPCTHAAAAKDIYDYASSTRSCRLAALNGHFFGPLHPEAHVLCGHCDTCQKRRPERALPAAAVALRKWRSRVARERSLQAFAVLTDREIRRLCTICPKTEADLEGIDGVRRSVLKEYGSNIIAALWHPGQAGNGSAGDAERSLHYEPSGSDP